MFINTDLNQYFQELENRDIVTLAQSKGFYFFHLANGKKLVCVQNKLENPTIHFFGVEYKIPFTNKKILKIEGDAIDNNINEKELLEFYTKVIQLNYSGIEWNSELFYSPQFEVTFRRAGFVRPMSMFSCPLTIEVDLSSEVEYNRNWKRNIKKGIEKELKFEEIIEINDKYIHTFIVMFNEMAQLKGLSYHLTIESLKALFKNDSGYKLYFVYDGLTPMAGRIVYVRGNYATDVFAANSNESRNNGATFFIMDSIFHLLKEQGVERFDFARIPPSNHASDSVYQYKIGSGGEVKQYMGEWVYYKSKLIEMLMLVYKTFKQKKQRY